MYKTFNANGCCDPELHYMVDLSGRLKEIKAMIDAGLYFTMNRARQYGKTTTLMALAEYLKNDYQVLSLDFQAISYGDFETEQGFAAAFSREILDCTEDILANAKEKLALYAAGNVQNVTLSVLFKALIEFCKESEKKLVLIIDEADSATNNQVFVDFLLNKGYMLSFNFNKKKEIGVKEIVLRDKILIEAVV